jgi:hypothetical protein
VSAVGLQGFFWGLVCSSILDASVVAGTSEAFVHAVVTRSQLLQSSAWMLVFSVLYMCLSVLLTRAAPSTGIILANAISILLLMFCKEKM